MKLGRTALLVLGIGIFIIAFVTIYYMDSGQTKEQAQLNDRLATAQALLPKLIAEKEDWQSQITQAENKVAEATLSLSNSEARFPITVESFDYNAALFKTAYDCDLQVVEITVSKPSDEEVKDTDITYAVTTFKVVVQSMESPPSAVGDFKMYIDKTVANMVRFIHAIAIIEEFNVCNIKQVDMENLEPLDEEQLEKVAGAMKLPKATIQLTIYGFPG